ncbi:MAG: YgiT-type zinc finger protein [Candidatus Methylomirabilis sp.]|nr:YgiT-type zinc finger protein [Deltaproteobacteria bacterium]
MTSKGNGVVCDNCGKSGAKIVRTTESYGQGRDLLVIEGIPMVRCPHCHEMYFTAETVRKVDGIRREKRTRAEDRTVKVARFG